MELKWLKDYIALVEQGSFSKAAATRFVTQPAFSRRIRSLEAWMGISLVERNQYPLVLTPAGDAFIERAKSLTDSILLCREQLRSMHLQPNVITLSSQQSLAVAFFPAWIEDFDAILAGTLVRMNTVDLHEAVETFLGGSSDFLLCYDSQSIYKQLQADEIESLHVGVDQLIPVCAADNKGKAMFTVDSQQPLQMLSHTPESFFGQLVASQCLAKLPTTITLKHRYQSSLSEALKALVLKGKGIAYLPRSIITQELADQQLVQIADHLPSIDLQISLYRLKYSQSIPAKLFWQQLNAVTP
ncbi:MAG: LysR family transcriptional regulator [Oceanospirillaceae bacterium]